MGLGLATGVAGGLGACAGWLGTAAGLGDSEVPVFGDGEGDVCAFGDGEAAAAGLALPGLPLEPPPPDTPAGFAPTATMPCTGTPSYKIRLTMQLHS